jgi:hypothetical protein
MKIYKEDVNRMYMIKAKQRIAYEIAMGRVPDGWIYSSSAYIWRKGRSRITDLEIYKIVKDHTCAICGEGPDPDIRYLRIGCLYDLKEVSEKFEYMHKREYYLLPFCKPCRGHFVFEVLKPWVESKGHKEHPNWNGEAIVQFV